MTKWLSLQPTILRVFSVKPDAMQTSKGETFYQFSKNLSGGCTNSRMARKIPKWNHCNMQCWSA
jgi:hypothetical protein